MKVFPSVACFIARRFSLLFTYRQHAKSPPKDVIDTKVQTEILRCYCLAYSRRKSEYFKRSYEAQYFGNASEYILFGLL